MSRAEEVLESERHPSPAPLPHWLRGAFWLLALLAFIVTTTAILLAFRIGSYSVKSVTDLVAQAQLMVAAIALVASFATVGVTAYYAWQTRVLVMEMRLSRDLEVAIRRDAVGRDEHRRTQDAVVRLIRAAGDVIAVGEAVSVGQRLRPRAVDVEPLFRAVADASAALERIRLVAPQLADPAGSTFDLVAEYAELITKRSQPAARRAAAERLGTSLSELKLTLSPKAWSSGE